MKNLALILSVCMFCGNATALDLLGNTIVDGDYEINEGVTVHDGIVFEAHDIKITDSLYMGNFGEVHGGINVCANCTLELENAGVFDAAVSLQGGAHIVQVITSNETATDIGLASGFGVSVRDVNGISLNTIRPVIANAESVELINVQLNVGDMTDFVGLENVALSGDIVLNFDSVSNAPVLLFANATGDGVVYVDSSALDNLHAFQTYKVDQDIFVRLARSTDYARILNNDMGKFLNDLRASKQDDKLFSKLDTVETMGGINKILSRSVRTNPIKLMQPISMWYSHKMLEIMHIDDGVVFGLKPFAIYSSDAILSGIEPSARFNLFDDLHLELSGYAMNIKYTDDINEYSGSAYGGEIDGQYDITGNDFVRAHFGLSKSYFDIAPVFDGHKAVNNPDGNYLYASGEYGHIFDLGGGYKLSPFAGMTTERANILNATDTSVYGFGGADVGYEYVFDGLRYTYTARALARTDGAFGGGINIAAWSIFDAAGGIMRIDVIHDKTFGMSYGVSLDGIFRF